MNIHYLTDNDRKRELDAMLLSYNLVATVHFPTRIQNQSNTAIDISGGSHIGTVELQHPLLPLDIIDNIL
jgi:hypothetical protein